MQYLLILGLLIAVLAVIFAAQNMAAVTITVFAWHVETRLAVALMIALIAGALIAVLISLPGSIKNSIALSGARKKLTQTETERDQVNTDLEQARLDIEKGKQEVADLELQLASYTAELSKADEGKE
jgi:lipopolysaccharide assembly protein A